MAEEIIEIVDGLTSSIDETTSGRQRVNFAAGTSSPSTDGAAYHWVTILLITFSIVTVTINLLLLLVFTKRRSLRTVSNRFVINLLFISLTSSVVLVPFIIIDEELFGTLQIHGVRYLLLLGEFTLNFICTASILSILLIGIDQYLAVLHPLRCHSYMNKPKSCLLILLSYVVSLTSSTLATITNGNQRFFQNYTNNTHHHDIDIGGYIFGVFYLSAIIVAPFCTICIIYVLIYRAAHKNSERLRRSHFEVPKQIRTLPKVQSAPSFINQMVDHPPNVHTTLPKTIERTHSDRIPNIITSLRTKISNASAFRYREENRTAKISMLVIVMVLLCYAPYGVMYLLNAMVSDDRYMIGNRVAVLLLVSSNLLSPILFALRNRRVQRELKKFLCGKNARYGEYGSINRRHSRPQIVIQHIETNLNLKNPECVVQIEPFLPPIVPDFETKSILKRVCSKNWGSYKKCSFINVPDGCLDARGSFSSASTQISTEE